MPGSACFKQKAGLLPGKLKEAKVKQPSAWHANALVFTCMHACVRDQVQTSRCQYSADQTSEGKHHVSVPVIATVHRRLALKVVESLPGALNVRTLCCADDLQAP